MADLAFAAFGAAFGLPLAYVGAALVRKGRSFGADNERIASTERSEAGSVEPGPVAVRGTASRDGDATVSEPLDGEDVLLVRVSIERWTGKDDALVAEFGDQGPDTSDGAWSSQREVLVSKPFLVDDGTGQVGVEVEDGDSVAIHGDGRTQVRRDPGEADPEGIRRFLQREAEVGPDDSVSEVAGRSMDDQYCRFTVDVVRPGDEVYVLGTASEPAGWDDGPVVSGGEEGLILSDQSGRELRAGNATGQWLMYGIGGAMALFGILFVVAPWLL